jgi:hypothetical protein
LFHFKVCSYDNQVFEGFGLEQHWRPLWLSLELIMPAKNKALKPPADRAKASKATAFAATEIATRDGTVTTESLASQAVGDSMVPPLGREEMPEGVVQEAQLDQDGNEVPKEDEDGEINE